MRSKDELEQYRMEIGGARGAKSDCELIDRLLAGDESVREQVESALDQIDKDCE